MAEKRKADAVLGSRFGQISSAAKAPNPRVPAVGWRVRSWAGQLVTGAWHFRLNLAVGLFRINNFRLGVKDVMFRMMERSELDMMLEQIEGVSPHRPIDPVTARKLLHDVSSWENAAGFHPHQDYPAVKKRFDEVDALAARQHLNLVTRGTHPTCQVRS